LPIRTTEHDLSAGSPHERHRARPLGILLLAMACAREVKVTRPLFNAVSTDRSRDLPALYDGRVGPCRRSRTVVAA